MCKTMRHSKFITTLALALLLAVVTSCTNSGEYVIGEDTVCYSYWTFSFGTIKDTLPGANPKTFKTINKWSGHDGKNVYFQNILVKGADAATVQADKFPLLYDKRDYYYKGVAMHVANVDKFKTLKWFEDDMWATDGTYAFYDSIRIKPQDMNSFKVKTYNMAVDSKYVYRYGKILPLADPATYEEEWDGYFSRDKSHIWHAGTLLEDADYATFKVDKDDVAHDKHGYFWGENRISKEEIDEKHLLD